MRLEEFPEEEAQLEEAQLEEVQLEAIRVENLEESAMDDCVVSEQREYLVGKKELVDVADGIVESFSQEESR